MFELRKYELIGKKIIAVIYTTFAVVKRKPEFSWLVRCTGIAEVIGFESRTSLIFFSVFLLTTAKVVYITVTIFPSKYYI